MQVSLTTVTAFDLIERAPAAIVNVEGGTSTQRKLSALIDMSRPALIATAAFGGKTGKAAMASIVHDIAHDLAAPAAWPRCDYRPLAQTIAAQLGEVVVISNRSSFEALVDQFTGKIETHKAKSKTGGYRTNKDGIESPDATLSKLMQIKQLCADVIDAAREMSAANKAKHEALKAEKAEQLETQAEKAAA
jgi:hypothetical protein